jgi:bisphosphoglycerate-independent phosphoglycerate mutase (AlkP superfamily)
MILFVFLIYSASSLPMRNWDPLLSQKISTMSQYNAEFPFPVAFPPQVMTNVLAECISKKGLNQAHIAGQFLSRSPHS